MSKIHILGTGNAMVTKCYNTCFTISNEEHEHFLVDTGGGNTILTNLEKSNISISNIHHVFLSHTHNDHINGISWIVRSIAQKMINNNYHGNLTIYGEKSVLNVARQLCTLVLGKKFTNFFDDRIFFVSVSDGEKLNLLDFEITFFDILSTKIIQYGFKLTNKENKSFVFLGDEPFKPELKIYSKNATYLMHEAFCLFSERDIFKPYEKHHATVKEASLAGTNLNISNLILIHTEDKNINNRRNLYIEEGLNYYTNNLIVPDDLDIIHMS